MATLETTLAQLAIEYWRLLRAVERAIEAAPDGASQRLQSQARYAAARLQALLMDQKMSIQVFDGMDFEVNLPASPVNGEDFLNDEQFVIERTLEPAVLSDMRVILMGKVILTKKE
jgi:hypothetical protein